MLYQVTMGGRTFEVELGPDGARVGGEPVEVSLQRSDQSPVGVLHVDRRTHPLLARRLGRGRWSVALRGMRIEAEVIDERTKAIREMTGVGAGPTGPRAVVAPMPGMVLRVEVEEGDTVTEGQGVVIVEAMKMENELRAVGAGVVSRVLVSEGEAVEKDQVLVELAAPEAES